MAEALRAAIERTLAAAGKPARTGSVALPTERATQLLDEVVRRGSQAREQLTKRGQDAGARLTRGQQDAREELANRLEGLERRLAILEDALRTKSKPKAED